MMRDYLDLVQEVVRLFYSAKSGSNYEGGMRSAYSLVLQAIDCDFDWHNYADGSLAFQAWLSRVSK